MAWFGTRQQNSASDGHKTQAGEGIRTPYPLFTRAYLKLYVLLLAVPLTEPFFGVTAASHLPFASLIVQERLASFFLPCLIVTFLQEPFFVIRPLFEVSV